MGAVLTDQKSSKTPPLVKVKIVYARDGNGNGLKDAYRLLAKKVREAKGCRQQSMSE